MLGLRKQGAQIKFAKKATKTEKHAPPDVVNNLG